MGALGDLQWAESVHMDVGSTRLGCLKNVQVVLPSEVWMDATLQCSGSVRSTCLTPFK